MRMRQLLAVGTVAVLALTAAACGDDAADETTTTAADSTETTVAELSDEEFDAQVELLLADLEAAGTDLCAVLQAASATGPEAAASTEAQVRTTVDAQVKILQAIAATEPVDEANAAVINRVAGELADAAEQDGYSTDFLESEEFATVLGGDDFTAALQGYQTRQASECEDSTIPEDGSEPTTTVAGEG